MRIGLISDTHGSLETVFKAIVAMGKLDLLIHAGDHYRDAVKISTALNIPVEAVAGNCDRWDEGPEEKVLELDGALLFITHGHRYNAKLSITGLINKATELKADAAIYGHTHIPGYCYINGLLIINPGSISKPIAGGSPSYGILEINKGSIKPAIFNL